MPRKHELWWTEPALEDLKWIGRDVRRGQPSSASSLAKRIRERLLSLRDYPLSGRIVPELGEQGYRELIPAPYRIVYEVRERRVIVLRVWHGRRELGAENLPDEDSS